MRKVAGKKAGTPAKAGMLAVVILGLSMMVPVQTVSAADIVKTLTGGPWITASLWEGGVYPGASDTAVFTNTTTADVTANLNGNQSVYGLQYNYTGAGAYLIGYGTDANSTLTIGAGGITVQGGAGTPKITANIALDADQTWSVSGVSQLVAPVGKTLYNNGHTLTVDGANSVAINGGINGSGGIIKNSSNGSSVLSLYNASPDFSGGVTLNSGVVRLNNNLALGTGTLTINGGSVGTVNLVAINAANAISVNGDFGYSSGPSLLSLTLSGAMDLNGATRTITQGITASTQYLNGVISNGGLIKAGAGVLSLGGINTYNGDTTVSAGELLLADNSQMLFTIGANGVNNKIDGSGTLQADGDFVFDLTGAASAGNWTIVDVATLTENFGTTFSVVDFTDNGNDTWSKQVGEITYTFDETTGVLSAIPEPATIALFGFSGAIIMIIRRRLIMQ